MDPSRIDVFLAGNGDGYVIAPAGSALPLEEMRALGGICHGWSQDVGESASRPEWRALRRDIEACGYSIVSDADFAALLLPPRLQSGKTTAIAGYPAAA
ncbi:hypothetical protein [Luteimonas salinilitoris]|uniref:Uncharacterized protein n=1 Tax=Luteimonas salinilitoris TaxID=3237697 RepID=A0ABV4HK32_9GAMM